MMNTPYRCPLHGIEIGQVRIMRRATPRKERDEHEDFYVLFFATHLDQHQEDSDKSSTQTVLAAHRRHARCQAGDTSRCEAILDIEAKRAKGIQFRPALDR